MEKPNIKKLFRSQKDYIEKDIEIKGWVRTLRSSKNFGFIEVNDGSFFKNLQVVFEDFLENFDEITKITVGSAIEVQGTLVESEGNKQPFELKATKVKVVNLAPSEYPLQKKRHTFEYLRTIAHLRPRTNTFSAVFRVRSILSFAIHQFFQERDFVYVQTPIITGSDCEGAGEMFRVSTFELDKVPKNDENKIDFTKDFFGKETNLTVSGQLEGESYAHAFQKIYTFGPTFRAENSNTARHAAEFWMIEPEIAFANLTDDMDLAEDMMKYLIEYLMKKAPEEMDFFNRWIDKELFRKLDVIQKSKFERITYTEAVKILKESKKEFQYPVDWGINLQTEHERFLSEEVFKKPVFVTDYPKDIKAFYMKLNDDEKTVAAVDLLVPGVGEIIGGSQREDSIEILKSRMKELDLPADDYWWYLELRKFGGTPHAGFGLGFERAIMYFTGMKNIRDVISFPRTPGHAEF